MSHHNLPPSNEVYKEALIDLLIAEDWDARLTIHGTKFRELSNELEKEQDPQRVLDLAAQKQTTLIQGVGSGILSMFKRDILAERAKFEAEFGER